MPEIDQEFVGRMEDVLALYARPYSKAEPVICFDEAAARVGSISCSTI